MFNKSDKKDKPAETTPTISLYNPIKFIRDKFSYSNEKKSSNDDEINLLIKSYKRTNRPKPTSSNAFDFDLPIGLNPSDIKKSSKSKKLNENAELHPTSSEEIKLHYNYQNEKKLGSDPYAFILSSNQSQSDYTSKNRQYKYKNGLSSLEIDNKSNDISEFDIELKRNRSKKLQLFIIF